jgi:TatD DNase family protein
MWIDTHCHLDAAEFDADRDAVVERAVVAGVGMVVIPAVDVSAFDAVRACAHRYALAYALGIHPLAVASAREGDLERLASAAQAALADPRFVAIGEIGLDAMPGAPEPALQEHYYREQLLIARRLDLPVILHVRRSADRLLYHLRRVGVAGGIAHAFNGSPVQAQGFIDLGFRLGFGGASTYAGSLRIRRFAATLPLDALVLETDAPDIPPQWLRAGTAVPRNEPSELPRIAEGIATLRGMQPAELARATGANARVALPRLRSI